MKRPLIQLLALAILLATVADIKAQDFTINQVLSAPFPSGLTAAPAGDRIAWVFNKEGIRNIWMANGPDYQARPITRYAMDDGQTIGDLEFSPDGHRLFFVRGDGPNRQGENPNPTSRPDAAKQEIHMLTGDTGVDSVLAEGSSPRISPDGKLLAYINQGQVWSVDLTRDSSKPQALFRIRGNAGSLSWSPDVTAPRLAFVSNRGDHAFVGIYDKAKNSIQYLSPSVDRDGSPVWSPNGSRLAFLRMPNEKQRLPFIPRREGLPWSILVADAETGEARTVWTAPSGMGSVFRFVSAENQLLWGAGDKIIFPWEGEGWTHLYTVGADGGPASLLTPGSFEVQFVTVSPDGQTLLYSSNQDDIDRQHVWRVAVAGGPPRPLTKGKGIEWLPVQTAASGHVFFLSSTGTRAAHPARLTAPGTIELIATDAIPGDFPQSQLVEPEAVVFPAADGMNIHGQLFLPKDRQAGEKHPAILFFHGGSRRQMLLGFHHRGYYHNAYALNQYLADRGYVVLSVNYRSGIGYGMFFREALNYGANGASEFNDVLGAGLYLRQRDDVDPARIGLWGGSYGGYLTALGLARAPELFAAGVDIHGVHDWNVVIRNFVPSYQAEQNEQVARRAFESSPMAYLDTWRSPVLLIHGDDDRNVPFSETVDLAESLRRKGVYFEQLIFPDEVHGFLLHRNWLEAYEATAGFFDRHLGKP